MKLETPSRLARGFSLVEALVVVAIIGALAALLFPALSSTRKAGRSVECLSNLRQIGMALHAYANDNDNTFPHGFDPAAGYNRTWMQAAAPYIGMPSDAMGPSPLPRATGVFICPEWQMKVDRAVSYGLNAYIDPIFSFPNWNYRRSSVSSSTFLVVEMARNTEWFSPMADGDVSRRHPGKSANFLFVDGHVESIREQVPGTDPRWSRQ